MLSNAATYITLTEGNFGCIELPLDHEGNAILHDDDGSVIDAARVAFTRGQCHALAVALHDLTGWDLVVMSFTPGLDGWDHAAVRHPDGDLVDIDGRNAHERWEHILPYVVDAERDTVADIGYPIPEDHAYAAELFATALLPTL